MSESKKDINWYLNIIVALIAILAFFGIKECNDIRFSKKLNGMYRMTYYFKDCTYRKYVDGELECYYDINFSTIGNGIRGEGFKHSETFEGNYKRYSKNFAIEIIGSRTGKEVVAKTFEDNSAQNKKVEGTIRINLKTMKGIFNVGFQNCAGEIKIEKLEY